MFSTCDCHICIPTYKVYVWPLYWTPIGMRQSRGVIISYIPGHSSIGMQRGPVLEGAVESWVKLGFSGETSTSPADECHSTLLLAPVRVCASECVWLWACMCVCLCIILLRHQCAYTHSTHFAQTATQMKHSSAKTSALWTICCPSLQAS